MNKKTVLAFSGGVDSTVLLYHLLDQGDQVFPVFFDYGSKHNKREFQAAERIAKSLGVTIRTIDLGFLPQLVKSNLLTGGGSIPDGQSYDQQSLVVPGRNSVFGAVMIAYAETLEADRIALAIHADDHSIFPDTRPEWVAALRLLTFHASAGCVGLYTPFNHMSKRELIEAGKLLRVNFSWTWTCYQGGVQPCGSCKACVLRRESFLSAGMVDPVN